MALDQPPVEGPDSGQEDQTSEPDDYPGCHLRAPLTGNGHILLSHEAPYLSKKPNTDYVHMGRVDFIHNGRKLPIGREHYWPSFVARDVNELRENTNTRKALREHRIFGDPDNDPAGGDEGTSSTAQRGSSKPQARSPSGKRSAGASELSKSDTRKSGENKSRDSSDQYAGSKPKGEGIALRAGAGASPDVDRAATTEPVVDGAIGDPTGDAPRSLSALGQASSNLGSQVLLPDSVTKSAFALTNLASGPAPGAPGPGHEPGEQKLAEARAGAAEESSSKLRPMGFITASPLTGSSGPSKPAGAPANAAGPSGGNLHIAGTSDARGRVSAPTRTGQVDGAGALNPPLLTPSFNDQKRKAAGDGSLLPPSGVKGESPEYQPSEFSFAGGVGSGGEGTDRSKQNKEFASPNLHDQNTAKGRAKKGSDSQLKELNKPV